MKQQICCSHTASFISFLQLPINIIFPLSVVYEIIGGGLFVRLYMCPCMYVTMYVCTFACMHGFMCISVYVFIMHACMCVCRPTHASYIYS